MGADANISVPFLGAEDNEPAHPRRILVTEDDFASQKIIEGFLSEMGFIIECHDNGRSAWDRLQDDDAPNLLMVDWMMPEMNGLALVKKIMTLKRRHSFYIIMVTSHSSPKHIATALEAGANDYILKPYSFQELRARINVALRVLDAEADLIADSDALKQLAEQRARQLLQADKMVTVGTLAAGIAHEINNPATLITGNLNLLEECVAIISDAITPEMQATFDKRTQFALEQLPGLSSSILSGVKRITKIASGLKTYSRKSDPNAFRTVDIATCVDEALALCHNHLKYNITVQKQLEDEPLLVIADEQQVVQILVNLLINAADALKQSAHARIEIAAFREGPTIIVAVADNGPGISMDVQARVFDPFFTTKAVGKGTGLGLSISHNIALSHGGTLEVSSEESAGTVFELALPAKRERRSRVAPDFLGKE